MTTLLTILVLLVAVAALEAGIAVHDTPPPPAPRRNYDVLAPAAPRVGATRRPSVRLSGPDWLVIRDERPVHDGRQ